MALQESAKRPVGRGLAEKREAITRAARTVFAREGYVRASVDAIASEAGVSKRTIYNHFKDKEHLFLVIMEESSHVVADANNATMERHLARITDPEADLIAFSQEWMRPVEAHSSHFGLVRVIVAEAGRLPSEVLEAWQTAGPRANERELARWLRTLSDRGLLDVEPGGEALAARNFALLVSAEPTIRSYYGAVELPEDEVTRLITDGVRSFLRIYGAKPER